ncbi:MAG: flagellar basal body P-ring formation chaperone FlgA [Pseudomonadota bacterium]
MKPIALILCVVALIPQISLADTVVAAHTIRAQSILTADDLALKDMDVSNGVTDVSQLIGKENRVALYAGRPIRMTDVGPPAVIARNQIIQIVYRSEGLMITTEGRSLGRAGLGEYVRVMNMASRKTVFGVVLSDGRVFVSR